MTDKKDPHAELMAQVDRYARRFSIDAFDTLRTIRTGIETSIRTLADRLAQPAPAASASITLDFKQASELLEMFGGEPAEITLQIGDGHSGKGVYAHYTDMPEEGAECLGMPDNEAIPSTQPHQIAEPASDKIAVDKAALREVLQAINGPGHYIRELQATRNLPIGPKNPINILTEEFNTDALRAIT